MIQRTTFPGRVEYRDFAHDATSIATYPAAAAADPLALLGSAELSAILAGTLTVVADPLGIWDDPDDPESPQYPDARHLALSARAIWADQAAAIVAREVQS